MIESISCSPYIFCWLHSWTRFKRIISIRTSTRTYFVESTGNLSAACNPAWNRIIWPLGQCLDTWFILREKRRFCAYEYVLIKMAMITLVDVLYICVQFKKLLLKQAYWITPSSITIIFSRIGKRTLPYTLQLVNLDHFSSTIQRHIDDYHETNRLELAPYNRLTKDLLHQCGTNLRSFNLFRCDNTLAFTG